MTESEAKMAINRLMCGNTAHSRNASYIKLAIEALEKQIPKKPKKVHKEALVKKRIFDWECSCGRIHRNDFPLNYCSECGQKIDWEGVAE